MNKHRSCTVVRSSRIGYVKQKANPYSTDRLCFWSPPSPRITRTTVFLLTALDERVAPLLQIRRMKAGVREATVQHVCWEIFLLRAVWHQNIIWRFEHVQRKTRLFLRWKQMDTLMIIHLWIYGNVMFIGHNKKVRFLFLSISLSGKYLL